MTNTFLPYARHDIDEHDIEAVADVLRGDFLTTGPTPEAFEDRLADIEREKKYAAAKRRDGISSKSQALSKCKNELRSMTNSGYYMNYSVETQRRMMTSQIDSCMYQYGYFGR